MTSETRNNSAAIMYAKVLQGICAKGGKAVGEAIQRDPSFVSRIKSGENKLTLEEFCNIVSTCGFAMAAKDLDSITIKKSTYKSLCEFAEVGLKFIKQTEE